MAFAVKGEEDSLLQIHYIWRGGRYLCHHLYLQGEAPNDSSNLCTWVQMIVKRMMNMITNTDSLTDRMDTTSYWPLQHRHPLIVITEQGEIQIGARAVRLGADGQLGKHAPNRLRVAPESRAHYRLFESLVDLARV